MMAPELEQHVRQLARELGALVLPPWAALLDCEEEPCGAAGEITLDGGPTEAIIWVSEEPVTAEAYLVALHELGHLATSADDPLLREMRAWQWAIEHSLIPITARLENFIDERMDTYRD